MRKPLIIYPTVSYRLPLSPFSFLLFSFPLSFSLASFATVHFTLSFFSSFLPPRLPHRTTTDPNGHTTTQAIPMGGRPPNVPSAASSSKTQLLRCAPRLHTLLSTSAECNLSLRGVLLCYLSKAEPYHITTGALKWYRCRTYNLLASTQYTCSVQAHIPR